MAGGMTSDEIELTKDMSKNKFIIRDVDEWDRLGRHVVSAITTDTLKSRFDNFMDREDRL